ncbi:DUF488 domain-containing protein [candidate division WOR-3 bacterium]|nr:DUF488 domain-containing protein [candidate division WOR-3 bacterium]
MTVYTVGHSTRPIGDFLDLLEAHGIKKVVDVRTIPKSRHNPQFNQDELKRSLADARIGYRHLKVLGGLRHALRDSVNTGWRNLSFRGFADYMQTEEFDRGIELLETIARKQPTAIMCAEGNPWRCHRSLIGDALAKRKWQVLEISSRKAARPHRLTPFLRMRKGRLVYPAEATADKARVRIEPRRVSSNIAR